MKTLKLLLVMSFFNCLLSLPAQAQDQDAQCAAWLDHEVVGLHTEEVIDLCALTAGHPLLLVNTASYCGFTYQFEGLEALSRKYQDQGLLVIGFPSDDFNQEDDDASKTAEVCYVNYGVSFTMTEVLDVKNSDAHPVFAHLGSEAEPPGWNFNKYLVDRDGNVVQHFSAQVEPDAPVLERAIESVL